MIYVLLDTNIIIDMVVDRRNNVIKGDLLTTFIKLLNYGEVKVIVPNVVKTETYRHLYSELDIVGDRIDNTIKAIRELYGISTLNMDSLDLSEYKKKAIADLKQAQDKYQQHKSDYQQDIHRTINLLFNHENTIIIDDEDLMSLVLKRRIYKRAPFHKEGKESFGDGTITETLVHLKDKLEIDPSDTIFFVTENYSDFSDTANKKNDDLHPHIAADLALVGLASQVVYVRSFGNLLHPHLETNIKSANLADEFEAEMQAEEAEMKSKEERHYQYLEDNLRDSAGLTPLGDFVDRLEDCIPESTFAEAVTEQFDRLNRSYAKLEDLSAFYEDELQVDNWDCSELVHVLSGVVGCSDEPKVENIITILNWIERKTRELELIEERLPDTICIGEDTLFVDIHRKEYCLSIDSLEHLTPENGGTDTICVKIVDNSQKLIAEGTIDVSYGFIEEDISGNIGNGCNEDISFNTELIVEKLKEISDEWESFIEENQSIVETIRSQIDL